MGVFILIVMALLNQREITWQMCNQVVLHNRILFILVAVWHHHRLKGKRLQFVQMSKFRPNKNPHKILTNACVCLYLYTHVYTNKYEYKNSQTRKHINSNTLIDNILFTLCHITCIKRSAASYLATIYVMCVLIVL